MSAKRYKIAIASDHAGTALKSFLVKSLGAHAIADLGPNSTDSVDYPDFAAKLCLAVQRGEFELGILVCGSGIGMSIAANKFEGIRAAHVESVYTAQLAGEHNRANVLCLGERITGLHHALAMVQAWLAAEFGGANASPEVQARHQVRIDKIHSLEKKS